jgi:hypothetical protein
MELTQIHISELIWTKLCPHVPLGLEETVGYIWTRNSWPLGHFGPFFRGATAESWAQDGCRRNRFPRYRYIRDSSWCSCDVSDMTSQTAESSAAGVILAGVSLTSRKWRRSRRQSHLPQRRILYFGACSRHVTDITFKRATGPSATALYPSFYLLFLWPTGIHVLAHDSCAFLLQVCCTVGNAYDTPGCERDPCVYNSETHQTEGSD